MIDTAWRLYANGNIDSVIVVAPSGVHLGWTREQLPMWWPNMDHLHVFEWDSTKASSGTKKYRDYSRRAVQADVCVWYAFNVEAFVPKSNASKMVDYIMRKRAGTLFIIDESHVIKTPAAKRTKVVTRLAAKAPFRRCLTGTAVTRTPLDLFAQYRALDPNVFGTVYQTFKSRYAITKRVQFGNGKPFDQIVGYRNMDGLRNRIAPITFVRKKKDSVDVPERLESVELFEMPKQHRRAYDQMLQEFRLELEQDPDIVASNVLVRMLRLHQISRGYIKHPETGDVVQLPGPTPAADRCATLVANNAASGGKTIVWVRFVDDVPTLQQKIVEQLKEVQQDLDSSCVVTCTGDTPQEERVELRRRFNEESDAYVWLGTMATGGIGVDLGAANLTVVYSHGFNMGERLQALERNYGSTQKASKVDIVDIVAADSIDQLAMQSLATKKQYAEDASVYGMSRSDVLDYIQHTGR